MKLLASMILFAGAISLSACSSTGVGAAVGGAAGAATVGGAQGTLGGAAVGGVIGHQIGTDRDD